ncbi:MAG: acetyltransferase [Gammaproteobacteria bacterium]|nr:acetyltransferase [Gammaproteobacteria bacterium]MCW8928364.1 acetyltransferase [Gammaproteobacteria bacterium]MCW8958979.1 acetyltransferase [Gammaproteobacteria bacterium]MCW8972166.1 acetyltransferase [Gammaproteobacteria bacterium]MCW8991816.1 acetyltransferase [Gammaproteobacteria bacterium]
MYLKDKSNGDLVEVLDTETLFDPNIAELKGRYHAGEEMQDAATFAKADLIFPSGESLPRCWVDPAYKS